ncbi:MAG TPA: type II toxin-antitoxin system HigB family toxin [Gemmatimonadaceae bacterium]
MHVISKKALTDFIQKHPAAELPVTAWFTLMKRGWYETPAALKSDFPSVSFLGGACTVFNIGGNNFRLVADVLFRTKRVYIKHVLTHTNYTRLSNAGKLC